MNISESSNQSPIVCTRELDVFSREQRERYQIARQQLKSTLQEVQELPDGYAFRFSAETVNILNLAEYITFERLCCRFFKFELEVEREEGPVWLRLTGGEGVKEFLGAEIASAENKVGG